MMQLGMDRLRSKHAASPEFGASSGDGVTLLLSCLTER
jgi:hypothetical protein